MAVSIFGLRTVEIVLSLVPKGQAPRNDMLGCVILTGAEGAAERSIISVFFYSAQWALLRLGRAKGRNDSRWVQFIGLFSHRS